jgi:uncharacterized protein YaiI (UPF0178 family)
VLVLVDGYNVTMRDPELAARSKEAQRDTLLARLSGRAASIAGRGARVVVVFDAQGTLGVSSESHGSVTTAYADSADDEIVRRCAAARGQVAVYTDDMRLRARISQDVGRHVEYRDVSLLLAPSRPSRSGRSGAVATGEDAADKALAVGEKDDITAELGELWLTDEKE